MKNRPPWQRVARASRAALALCAVSGGTAHAATLAGTEILNVAQASYTNQAGEGRVIMSNPVSFTVEEIIDVAVRRVGEEVQAVAPGASDVLVQFRVTNLGNGPEAFLFAAEDVLPGDQFDPTVQRLVVDSNGNGEYDPLTDTVYAPGSEPELDPDQSLNLFLFADVPAGVDTDRDRGTLALTATSTTGTGAPGTLFAGEGLGGVDAVIGLSEATSADTGILLVMTGTPSLAKAQVVDGEPLSGAIITYTLTADLDGALVDAPRISDRIPDGTSYVAGSLTLGGEPLSDVADADAGRFDGEQIIVALDRAATEPQTVTFQVSID